LAKLCELCLILMCRDAAAAQARDSPRCTRRAARNERTIFKSLWIIDEVADVFVVRATRDGTPNLEGADEWAVKTMTVMGIGKTRTLEPWTLQLRAPRHRGGWKTRSLLRIDVVRSTGN